MPPQPPPPVPGTVAPRWRDSPRLILWLARGLLHGARHAPTRAGRLFTAYLALCWPVAAPLLLLIQPALLARPSVRYYMSPQRDAILGLGIHRDSWHVQDHSSARPGTGQGRALRDTVVAVLLPAADQHGIALTAAANSALAARYRAEIPGLADLGRAWPRGRRLRREAAPALTEAEVEDLIRDTAAREGIPAPAVRWSHRRDAQAMIGARTLLLRRSMLRSRDEARFTALHELGHVALGHLTLPRMIGAGVGVGVLVFVPMVTGALLALHLDVSIPVGTQTGVFAGVVLMAIFLRLVRQPTELAADVWAAQRGGVLTPAIAQRLTDPSRFARFVYSVISTHPSPQRRLRHVQATPGRRAHSRPPQPDPPRNRTGRLP